MKSSAKFLKVINALANAIQAKDNSTDLLFHLQKEFPDYRNIKRLFDDVFNEEFLTEENLISISRSKNDNRKKEYHLTALHNLYIKLINLCKSVSELDCKYIIKELMITILIRNLFTNIEYNLLEKIEKEIKDILFPKKSRERDIYGFISLYSTDIDVEEIFVKVALKDIKKSIDMEKLTNEISILKKIINELKIEQ